ncbi:hypothetical protein C4901_11585 [Acidiferrobacter sp. SPIII_3]|jgi:excisionase family DNA binding protein|uniref:helix-turn-helix transcriptional regulator n=1 Tax=Acidiferrobacter sp. SPIII_3 TaxID=1281578 RepID=UPI000D72F8C1|nr:hypothetical protein C4901_11585 [Acidiferrobacter sp. SPIII_3]
MNMTLQLHGVKQVAAQLGCCTRMIQILVAKGEFPAPIRIGRLVRWREEDIAGWLQERAEEAQLKSQTIAQRRVARCGRPRNSARGV